jgi:hypothetical protein
MFESQRALVLSNLDVAHEAYYEAAVFGGPSLHFHRRALAAAQEGNPDQFAEAAYAMLASWGMHRMGTGGSKMLEFDEFAASIKSVWQRVLKLQSRTPDQLGEGDWDEIAGIFFGLNAMRSSTSLVGNSKIMAHALPKLVTPVDREYTLTLLFGKKDIRNEKKSEWDTLRKILEHFFYPISSTTAFSTKAEAWMKAPAHKWDTSPLKVLDNLIIGFQKSRRNEPSVPSPIP